MSQRSLSAKKYKQQLIDGSLRCSQMAALRQIRTKHDVTLLNFDQDQLHIYKKIRSVRPNVDNHMKQDQLASAVRRLK
jgi:hypothetical protein